MYVIRTSRNRTVGFIYNSSLSKCREKKMLPQRNTN